MVESARSRGERKGKRVARARYKYMSGWRVARKNDISASCGGRARAMRDRLQRMVQAPARSMDELDVR
jgi:hypothetical protein